ncbi:MAG: hypothetical protein ACI9UR_000402 [Bacteroidia bacterium]|jgi:hypothetical protein
MEKVFTLSLIALLLCANTYAELAPPPCEGIIQVSNAQLEVNDTVYACVGIPLDFEDVSLIEDVTLRTWEFGNGSPLVDGLLELSPLYAYPAEGTYTLTLSTNALACVLAQVTKTIIVLGQPQYNVTSQQLDCFGDCDGGLTLDIISVNAGLYNVVWDIAGVEGNTVTGLCEGNYNAFVADGFGCPGFNNGPFTISQPQELIASRVHPDTVVLCPSSGITNYQWSFSGGDGDYGSVWDASTAITQVSATQMQFTPTQQSLNQMYVVVVNDGLGCLKEDSIFFKALPSTLDGTVSVGLNPCVSCDVVRYLHTAQAGVWDTLNSTVTDGAGNYDFGVIENFLPFAIMANPNPINHPMASPEFYPSGHLSSTATILDVCGQTLNKHVQLLEPMDFSGTNTLNGTVWQSLSGKTQTEDPIPLIDVVVEKTPPGQAQGRAATNNNGEYEFEFVPNSDTLYTLYVSIPGLPVASTYEILADDGNEVFQNLNFCINEDTTEINICNPVITSEGPEAETEDFVVYPNPNNGRFTIETGKFASTQSEVRIVDPMGRLVFQKRYNETPFTINMVNVADGYYSVQIMNESDAQSAAISVIR